MWSQTTFVLWLCCFSTQECLKSDLNHHWLPATTFTISPLKYNYVCSSFHTIQQSPSLLLLSNQHFLEVTEATLSLVLSTPQLWVHDRFTKMSDPPGSWCFSKLLVPFLGLFCTRVMPGFVGLQFHLLQQLVFKEVKWPCMRWASQRRGGEMWLNNEESRVGEMKGIVFMLLSRRSSFVG